MGKRLRSGMRLISTNAYRDKDAPYGAPPPLLTCRYADKYKYQGETMSRLFLILIIASMPVFFSALSADTNQITVIKKTMTVLGKEVEVPVLVPPDFLPTYKGDMSAEQAARILNLTLPVVVTNIGCFEDGGTVTANLVDSHNKWLSFRRSPWALPPVYYYIDQPTSNGAPIRLSYDGEELKSIVTLSLHWVDANFTKKSQRKIRKKDGGANDVESAVWNVLWMFRPE